MASKRSGSTRTIRPTSGTKDYNRSVFLNEVSKPDIIRSGSYFSDKTGAYSLFMEGHNYVKEEVEAARILADEGYITILTPEGIELYGKPSKKKKNRLSYIDGVIAGFSYEQATPNPDNNTTEGRKRSVNNALSHARDKGARVALIYDKNEVFHREDMQAGIELFERHNKYRFQAIITINNVHPKNRVNEWEHTK